MFRFRCNIFPSRSIKTKIKARLQLSWRFWNRSMNTVRIKTKKYSTQFLFPYYSDRFNAYFKANFSLWNYEIRKIFYSIDAIVDLFFPNFHLLNLSYVYFQNLNFHIVTPDPTSPPSPWILSRKLNFHREKGNSRNPRTFHPLFISNNHQYINKLNKSDIGSISRK